MAGNRFLAAVFISSVSLGCLTGTQQKPRHALSPRTDPLTAQTVCGVLFISASLRCGSIISGNGLMRDSGVVIGGIGTPRACVVCFQPRLRAAI